MKIPSLVLVPLAALLFHPCAFADDAAEIGKIRALYAKIGKDSPTATETVKFDLEDDPMEGSITRRSYEGGLSAIKISYTAGDHGASDQNFYYDEKGAFFILIQDSSWKFAPGSTDEKPKTIDTLTETRYYVSQGKILRMLKRTASSGDASKLPALIAKAENAVTVPTEEDEYYLLRAADIRKVKTSAEAVKYFRTQE